MRRNSCSNGHFRITPVEDFSIFAGFSCLQPEDSDRDLDEFIQQDASRHFVDRMAVTYCLENESSPGVPLGFATLQNDAIVALQQEDLPEVKGYPYLVYPAVKIGRLGIHLDSQRNKYGSLLLSLLKQLMLQANRTGCRFITVDARRDRKNNVNVTPFYEKNGFSLLACRSRTSSYIPMYFDLLSMK